LIHFRVRFERLLDQIAGAQSRAAWVRAARWGLLAPVIALGAVALGVVEGARPWAVLAAAIIAIVVVRARSRWLRPAWSVARALDQELGGGELFVTALEVDRRGPRSGLEQRLLDDAASALATVARGETVSVARRALRIEIEGLGATLVLLAGAVLTVSTSGSLTAYEPMTRLSLPAGAGAGAGDQVGLDRAGSSPARNPSRAQAALAAAMGALPIGGPAAEALLAGDDARAADELRALAARVDSISEGGRAALAEALEHVGDDLAETSSDLAAAAELAAAGLSAAEPKSAEDALLGLADALGTGAGRRAGGARPAPTGAARRIEPAPVVARPTRAASDPGAQSTPQVSRDPGVAAAAAAAAALGDRPGPARGRESAPGSQAAGATGRVGASGAPGTSRLAGSERRAVRRYFQATARGDEAGIR